jgi:hypothetical protein
MGPCFPSALHRWARSIQRISRTGHEQHNFACCCNIRSAAAPASACVDSMRPRWFGRRNAGPILRLTADSWMERQQQQKIRDHSSGGWCVSFVALAVLDVLKEWCVGCKRPWRRKYINELKPEAAGWAVDDRWRDSTETAAAAGVVVLCGGGDCRRNRRKGAWCVVSAAAMRSLLLESQWRSGKTADSAKFNTFC